MSVFVCPLDELMESTQHGREIGVNSPEQTAIDLWSFSRYLSS